MMMMQGSPPVAPAVPPQPHSNPQQNGAHGLSSPTSQIAMVMDEDAMTHGEMMGRDPPAAAAPGDRSIGTTEGGVSQTTKHDSAMSGAHGSCLDSDPSTTWLQLMGLESEHAAVTPQDPSPRPLLPAKSLKRERTASSKPSPAAKERAKRTRMDDANKADRSAAVVEAFLGESGDRRPAVCPEKFRSGSVRQRVATRQLRILQKLRDSARAGGQSLPEDLVRQDLAAAQAAKATEEQARMKAEGEAAAAKAAEEEARVEAEKEAATARFAKQDVFSQATEPSMTSNAFARAGIADSEADEQAADEHASKNCGVQEETPLLDASMASQSDSDKAERGTQQQLGALDEADARHGDASAAAPHDASTLAALPTDDVQSSQTSDEQPVLDGPQRAAIGAHACCDVSETNDCVKTAALDALASAEVVSEMPKRLARALYDWTGGVDGDLNLNRGMVVTITDDSPGFGWWSGTVDGEVGIFPRCFVSPRVA